MALPIAQRRLYRHTEPEIVQLADRRSAKRLAVRTPPNLPSWGGTPSLGERDGERFSRHLRSRYIPAGRDGETGADHKADNWGNHIYRPRARRELRIAGAEARGENEAVCAFGDGDRGPDASECAHLCSGDAGVRLRRRDDSPSHPAADPRDGTQSELVGADRQCALFPQQAETRDQADLYGQGFCLWRRQCGSEQGTTEWTMDNGQWTMCESGRLPGGGGGGRRRGTASRGYHAADHHHGPRSGGYGPHSREQPRAECLFASVAQDRHRSRRGQGSGECAYSCEDR